MNAIKTKAMGIASKVTGSKVYKAVEKIALTGSAALIGIGASAMNTFAADPVSVTVDTSTILSNANSFISPAVTVLCAVGGIKLGWSFLKRSFH